MRYSFVIINRHKAILDYLHSNGYTTAFDSLKAESKQEDFNPDPKQKYAGLLEKKWTSVIRLQKKVFKVLLRVFKY